jgi:glycosyltransferase involved in cell wall biosynthesis
VSHDVFVAQYRVPLADPRARRPQLCRPGPVEGRFNRLLGGLRRRVRGRRLAYLDSHFPWARSGFRYADALTLHEVRPDTVFFSMYETTDPFPAPVLPLAEFSRLAPRLGVTDAYGVFLNFTAGLLGVSADSAGDPGPTDGLDISDVLRREKIRMHVCLYPGGGLVLTEESLRRVGDLVVAADQVFSYVPEVLERYPGVLSIDQAIIDTEFYSYREANFRERPVQILFVADAIPRKGLDVALTMERLLADSEDIHLHVVGPHDAPADTGRRATFHGWLEREQLAQLHARCPIFVSPVRRGRADEGDAGMVDGFPTAAASEAMSSGVLLISANPASDHRALRPGIDYIESAASAACFADAVRFALSYPDQAAAIAASGAIRVRERMSVKAGVRQRLQLMGLRCGG